MSDPIARAVTEVVARADRLRMRRGTWTGTGSTVSVGGGTVTVDAWVVPPSAVGDMVLLLLDGGSNIGIAKGPDRSSVMRFGSSYGSAPGILTWQDLTVTDAGLIQGESFGTVSGGKFQFTKSGFYRATHQTYVNISGDAFISNFSWPFKATAGDAAWLSFLAYGPPPNVWVWYQKPINVAVSTWSPGNTWVAVSLSASTIIEKLG